MLILSVPAGVAAVLFLLAPGILWAWRCWPAESRAERLAVGIALGFAFQMHAAALLAAGPRITTLSVLATTLAALLLVGFFAWRIPAHHQAARHDRRGTLTLIGVFAVITLVPMLPLAVHSVPQGWDPSFHSLWASTTVDTGGLPSWSRYEPILSNYPYGPHVIVAEMSLLSGLAPHQAFAVLLNAVIPLITGIALYAFARHVLPTKGAVLAAVAAYGLLGNWGSLDYGRWGGLPNAFGFFLLLAFLAVLFGEGFGRTRIVVGGLLLSAIPLAHHHVALTTVLLLSVYALYLIAGALLIRESELRQSRRATLRHLLVMAAIAFLVVAYYAVPYALRIREAGDTSLLDNTDHDPGVIFERNGWLLWVLALAGVILLFKARRSWLGKASSRVAIEFAIVASVTLLVTFVLSYYVYQAYSLAVYHHPYTAFAPTRFLTDLTYFLALFAGLALEAIWRWAATLQKQKALKGLSKWGLSWGHVVRGGIALVMLAAAIITMLPQFAQGEGQLAPGEEQVFTWVRTHTSMNAFVINLDLNNRWAPYFTRREVAFTPVTVSEFGAGYVAEKRWLVEQLLAVRQEGQSQRVVAMVSAGSALPALRERPVILLSDHTIPGIVGTPVFESGVQRVYEVPDFFASPTVGGGVISTKWWSGPGKPPSGWQEAQTSLAGWQGTPPNGGTAYLRLSLQGSLLAGVQIACKAREGAALYIDTKPIPNTSTSGCTGGAVPQPQLATPGVHVIAVEAQLGRGLQPWFDLLVLAGSAR